MKLFMILLGCRPKGRFTEQHDIFFGIGNNVKELIPVIKAYWPEAKGNIHIDAWREVNVVDGYKVEVTDRTSSVLPVSEDAAKLFFVNLGGYKENEFDEFHYKMLVAAPDTKTAQRVSMGTAFYKHVSLPKTDLHPKATSHIDDKYGIDVDDVFAVTDILSESLKSLYSIQLTHEAGLPADDVHLGYFKLTDFV